MKKILLLSILLLSTTSPFIVLHAQTSGSGVDYKLLEPLPLTKPSGAPDQTTNTKTYIEGFIKLIIAVAGGLAVLRIIIGGVQYMTTEAFSGKSEAKDTIKNAILGFLLAAGSFLIVTTINPDLATLNLSLQNVGSTKPLDTTIDLKNTVPTDGSEALGNTPIQEGPSFGEKWSDDGDLRTNLEKAKIEFNHSNCLTIGQQNCTSVYQISPAVINGVETLKKNCPLCEVTITGGTEYWMHGNRSTELDSNKTPHRPGGTVVDLSLTPSTLDFLKRNGKASSRTDCVNVESGKERYEYGGGLYVYETIWGNPVHWHVCF